MKLTQRLLIPTLTFLAILFAIVLSIQALRESRQISRNEEERLTMLMNSFTSQLRAETNLAVALALEVASLPQVQAALAARDRETLIALTLPAYQALQTVFDLPQYQFHIPPATSFLRLHQLDRFGDDLSGYRQTVLIANTTQTIVSGLEIGRGGPGLRGVVPVQYQGRHVGTVEFGSNIDQLFLQSLKETSGADWQISLRRDVVEIAVPGFVSTQPGPLPELLFQAGTLDSPIFSNPETYTRALNGETVYTHRNIRGGKIYGQLVVPLKDFSGNIIGTLDILIDRTDQSQLQWQIGVIFLTSLFLSLGIMAFGLTRISKRVILDPINTLTKAAEAMASGKEVPSIPVTRQDELGILANAFNQMRNQIQEFIAELEDRVAKRTRALEFTAKISRQLSTLQGETEMAGNVAREIQAAFDYYHVGIYLLNKPEQKLFMVASAGEDDQKLLQERHTIPVGEGLIGYAAAIKEMIFVPDTRQKPAWLPSESAPNIVAEIAVPILFGDEVLGVLDVKHNTFDKLGESEINLLVSIANEVAVALENVRHLNEMETNQKRFDLVIRGTNDGIWDWYIPSNQVYFSPRWKAMLGYEDHEIRNDFAEFESRLHPDDHDRMMQAVGNYLEGKEQTFEHEFRMKHKDGSYRWILVRASLARDAHGAPLRMAGSHTDITARKEAEARSARQSAQLQAIAEINTQMLAMNQSEEMRQTAVSLIAQKFNLSQTCIYLPDESGAVLELAASAGTAGKQLPLTIAFEQTESSVAQAARTISPAFYQSPTGHTELALPLLTGAQVSGVLLLLADAPETLTEADVEVMTTLANQLAAVLQSARALEETAAAVARANELTRRLTRSGWQQFAAKKGQKLAFAYQRQRQYVLPTVEITDETAVVQPLTVQGEEIGRLAIANPQALRDEAAEITAAIAQRLSEHLENLRLAQQTQDALLQTESLYEGSARIVQASTMSEVLQTLLDSTAMKRMERAAILFFNRPWEEQPDTIIVKATYARSSYEAQMPVGTRFPLKQFPIIYQVSRDKPVLLTNIAADESLGDDLRRLCAILRINSLIGIPLVSGDRWFGIVTAQSSQVATPFSEEEIRQIRSLVEQAASVLRTQQLLEEIQGKAAMEQTLRAITAQVYAAPTVEGVLHTAAKEVNRILGLETFAYLSGSADALSSAPEPTAGNGHALAAQK